MDIERKLLWWKYVESEIPQKFGWNILIINEPREIKMINSKISQVLELIYERRKIDSGSIKDSGGLHYDLFTLYSPTFAINFRDVYKGFAKEDRRLQRRESRNGWDYLIDKINIGEI
jgi:hypothetical protein